jgi:VWFA-related protein
MTGHRAKRGRRQTWILLATTLLWLAEPLPSQQSQAPTFSSDVKVVNVLATVRNKQGQVIHDLRKDDFSLEEDGRPQSIKYFAQETDLPLTLGLLVDTSLSQRRVLDLERDASESFIDQILREEQDKAFIIHFDFEIELLQDLTSSRRKLESALQLIEVSDPRSRPNNYPGGGGGSGGGRQHRGGHHVGGGGTALYDAVYLGADELMKKQTGRKALIILSDGVDNDSKVTLDTAIEAAQRADTLVYSILFSDEEAYSGFSMGGMGRHGGGRSPFPQIGHTDGKKVLERLSKETGGHMFEVSRKQSVGQIYEQIQSELRNQYSLGYTPERLNGAGGGYHRIHLATRQKDQIVQTRDGYYER